MKITKRQIRKLIRESGAPLSAGHNRDENVYNAAYDVIMDLLAEELQMSWEEQDVGAIESYNAWIDALRDAADETQLEADELRKAQGGQT